MAPKLPTLFASNQPSAISHHSWSWGLITKRFPLFVVLALLTLSFAGCRQAGNGRNGGEGVSTPDNTPAEAASPLAQTVIAAEQRWQAQDIHSYSMEIRHSRPNWSMQVIQLTVERGEIEKSTFTCFPETDCILQRLDPADFTIPKLFEIAHEAAPIQGLNPQLTFHGQFGYPTAITHDEGVWIIRGLKILD